MLPTKSHSLLPKGSGARDVHLGMSNANITIRTDNLRVQDGFQGRGLA